MNENIPKEILNRAQELLDILAKYDFEHAGEMKYLGKRKGIEYYTPYYPNNANLGFPTVFTIDSKGKCGEINEYDALDTIISF